LATSSLHPLFTTIALLTLASLLASMTRSSYLLLLLLLLLQLSSHLQLSSAAVISVNLTSRYPIDRRIYGTNFATENLLSWGTALNRNGGDAISNWNWQLDASNSGSDWYFITEPFTPSCNNGSSNDCQLSASFAAGASFISTISTIGHVTSTTQKKWSFSVAYYGAQTGTECTGDGGASWCAGDAGNGILVSGNTVLRNNLSWYQPSTPADAVAFVQHMRSVTGAAEFDANAILQLDNEPDNWSEESKDSRSCCVDRLQRLTASPRCCAPAVCCVQGQRASRLPSPAFDV
jgi:hypothetical protein